MAAQRRTTTQRGLGYQHQRQVEALKRSHRDGTPCWWCGRPMWLDKRRNFDGRVLEGDHSRSRARGGALTDRLLHGRCNGERGDGSRDDQRPALTGQAATQGEHDVALLMPWPWAG